MEALRNVGVDLKAFLTQTWMGLPVGSAPHGWPYGGKMTLGATFDGAKLGLWQGFYANIYQEWEYGNDINAVGSGAVLPINGVTAFPRVGGKDSDTAIYFTQRFGDAFSLSLGKYSLLEIVAKIPLVGGGGYQTFMNAGIAGPITGVIPPYLLGAVAILKTAPANFTLMVFDPRNAQDWDVISHPFSQGTTTVLTVTFPTKLAALSGFYTVRGVYSTKEGLNLAQIPGLVGLTPAAEDDLTKKGYWYLAGNFQQYLYEDSRRPGNGWGLFGHLSISDGNPNPIKWSGFVGFGGNTPLAGRELDKWGIAYFYYGPSPDLLNGLSTLGIQRQDERGVEAFYNFALASAHDRCTVDRSLR
jgi:porin